MPNAPVKAALLLVYLTLWSFGQAVFDQAVAAPAQGEGAAIYRQGAYGAMACAICHGRDGSGGAGPRLTGLSAPYVMRQLRDFRSSLRQSRRMHTEVSGLTVAELKEVAVYVAQLPHRPPPLSSGGAVSYAAKRLVLFGDDSRGIPACINCHGADLLGGGPEIPPLTGRRTAYLAKQLRGFRSGARKGGPDRLMIRISHGLRDGEIKQVAAAIAAWPLTPVAADAENSFPLWHPVAQSPAHFTPPAEEAVPPNKKLAALIRDGEHIFIDTPHHAPKFAGNALSCANCHLDRGRDATAAPMWAALPHFPMYRKKNHRVNTIQNRIQGCFIFSENGTPPPVDSHVMNALNAYVHWLSTGMPMGIRPKAAGFPKLASPPKPADRLRGKRVFMTRCAMCHGENGQGRVVHGRRLFPPLWGAKSFNWGAGMHKLNKAASFIRFNMPFGAGGSLSDQQAWDVAAFVDSHPRPQDPRFTGNVATTASRFHKNQQIDFYGRKVDGFVLGAPGTLQAWRRAYRQ